MATKGEGEILTGPNGGTRQRMDERWDLIPGGWQSMVEIAAIADYGAKKHSPENWKFVDPDTESAPVNHGLAHAFKALEYAPGSEHRIRQLAKAAWNFLAQIWFEKQLPYGPVGDQAPPDEVDQALLAVEAETANAEGAKSRGVPETLAQWFNRG